MLRKVEAFGICKIADMLGKETLLLLSSIVYGNLVPLQRQVFKGNIAVDKCLAGLDNCLAHEVCTDTQDFFTRPPPLSHSGFRRL